MTVITPAQAAAWMQPKIDHDDHAFRRRSGAADALQRLRAASAALVYRASGDRVDVLLGRRLGGAKLAPPRDRASAQAFVTAFYGEHGVLFSATALPAESLRVERIRAGSPTVAEVQQYVDGVPVADARWTLLFDADGYLSRVTGAPFDPARITVARRPAVTAEDAVALALSDASLAPGDAEATATLAVDARADRLVWTVRLEGTKHPWLSRAVDVDAHRRTVLARRDRRGRGLVAIPVTRYSHPGGIKDSTGSLATGNINVDSIELAPPKPNLPSAEFFSLQRLGSGRSRIWNGKPTGDDLPPVFEQTESATKSYFMKTPGTTTDNVFNEQQTYFWAQTLKTHVDEWGREPNAYGHYPVDASRAVNVDIVVNGDACAEDDFSVSGEMSVYHGYFRDTAPRSWFRGHPSGATYIPAVFLFNSDGNRDSPQFFGPEYSSSYSIVAHEVGHFISWQYGDWTGPRDTLLGASLDEGHSMVLAALFGKQHFSALGYDESAYVTTGGKTAGKQWSHFVYGTTALKYSAIDCTAGDQYYLAWPFVQAMWRLMNNMGPTGAPIWGTTAAAIANTADLFMYSLHTFTADSTMTWDKLCLGLLAHLYDRLDDGTEQAPLANTYCDVSSVFTQHGLLTPCVKSP